MGSVLCIPVFEPLFWLGCSYRLLAAIAGTSLRVIDTETDEKQDTRRHEHVAEPGELVFIPAGWPHEVTTLERSVGIGGSVINEHQIEQTVRSWRRERSLGLPSLADFPAVLRRQASRHCGDAGRRRVERALREQADRGTRRSRGGRSGLSSSPPEPEGHRQAVLTGHA